jgi:hypothetical protein
MKVVCINKHYLDKLTIGKTYDIIVEEYNLFGDGSLSETRYLIDDDGKEVLYGSINNRDFISLEDWREIKLKEIGL